MSDPEIMMKSYYCVSAYDIKILLYYHVNEYIGGSRGVGGWGWVRDGGGGVIFWSPPF